MQAQQPAPPYVPPANEYDIEANGNRTSTYGTGEYGYGQENGGVGGMQFPPPVNQPSRPTQPPSYSKGYDVHGQSIPSPMSAVRHLWLTLDKFLTTTLISATSIESRQ